MSICLNKLRKSENWVRFSIILFVLIHIGSTHSYAQKLGKDKFDKKSLVGKQKDESYIVNYF